MANAGRDPSTLVVQVEGAVPPIGENSSPWPEGFATNVDTLAGLGVTHLMLRLDRHDAGAALEQIEGMAPLLFPHAPPGAA